MTFKTHSLNTFQAAFYLNHVNNGYASFPDASLVEDYLVFCGEHGLKPLNRAACARYLNAHKNMCAVPLLPSAETLLDMARRHANRTAPRNDDPAAQI